MSDTGDLSRASLGAPMVRCSAETARRIRDLVAEHARLAGPAEMLADDSDLFAAGLTSLATVNLMLAIEDAFDVEIPDALLNRHTFSTITSLGEVVEQLLRQRDAL